MIWNALLLALREIRRNLLRSFLTILGIVIGVWAVIVMVTLGGGATAQITEQITSLGSNLLMVRTGQRLGMGQTTQAPPFDIKDVEAVRREVPSLRAVSATATSQTTVVLGNANWNTTVTGTDNDYFTVKDWPLTAGRHFSSAELRSGSSVCIIGETVRAELFGAQDPIGVKIRLGRFSCQVIGLLQSKGQAAMGTDQDDVVLIPLRTFWRRIAGDQDVGLIQISVLNGASTERAKERVTELLRERRRLSDSEEDDFRVTDMKEIAQTLSGTTRVLTALLGAVAAVSLLVGGIGIMNIMLVSVTERTREIGIRLAIGALEREVLLQFLVEAVVLSSFGGVVGIVLALVTSWVLAGMLEIPFILNPGIVLLAFLFSAAVGVLFGYFPARKAARLDPIDALRHE
ncbi:MAG: ABC transporter permease [Pseudomonadota bacterium]